MMAEDGVRDGLIGAIHNGERRGTTHPAAVLRSLVRSRQVIRHLVAQRIKAQYKQSFFGYAWILLNPLAQLATLTFIFSVVFDTPGQGDAPFILFVAIGLFP